MKRTIIFLIMVIMILGMLACSSEEIVTITTGGTGGTYYPLGMALAKYVGDNVERLTITPQAGNATVANCILIGEGKTESALVQNNVAYWAYTGEQAFEGTPVDSLRGIASLYPEAIQIVALRDSEIFSVEDLKGKRVCVGEQGSGVYADAVNVLEMHGMSISDLDAHFLTVSEGARKLKDKELDAIFLTAGYPTSVIENIASSSNLVLVPIAENKIEKLIKKFPYYAISTIPGETYEGIDEPVMTVATMAMWICSADLDEEMVYKMTKALWENQKSVAESHEKGKMITFETALDGMGIPLHPGAERYYQESR